MLAPEARDARRQRYVDAAWRIAERDGADRATMRAIAAEAGTSVGMLQHHVADKDEILTLAVRDRMAMKHAQLARSISALGDRPDPAEILIVALQHRLPLTKKLLTEARVLQLWLANAARSPLKADVVLESEALLGQVVTGALTDAQASGRLADDLDVRTLAAALVAMNDGLMHSLVLERLAPRRAREIVETQVRALVGDS